jgi:hypothetical protein
MRQEALKPNEAMMCASKWFDGSEGEWKEALFLLSLNEIKRPNAPLKFIATGQSPPTFGNPLIFGFAFRVVRIVGAGFRVGGSPQALRDFLTGFLKHGARPNTLAVNNQRTADLAGKAANSRVLRTVFLFAGVANGTFVIFGTRSPCCQHKAAIRLAYVWWETRERCGGLWRGQP